MKTIEDSHLLIYTYFWSFFGLALTLVGILVFDDMVAGVVGVAVGVSICLVMVPLSILGVVSTWKRN